MKKDAACGRVFVIVCCHMGGETLVLKYENSSSMFVLQREAYVCRWRIISLLRACVRVLLPRGVTSPSLHFLPDWIVSVGVILSGLPLLISAGSSGWDVRKVCITTARDVYILHQLLYLVLVIAVILGIQWGVQIGPIETPVVPNASRGAGCDSYVKATGVG